MYIHSLKLRNIRGFDNLDFNLQRPDGSYSGITVLLGDNGSGKSAALRALSVALIGKDAARALQPTFDGWIRHGSDDAESYIEAQVVSVPGDDRYSGTGRAAAGPFAARINLSLSSEHDIEIGNDPTRPLLERQRAPNGRHTHLLDDSAVGRQTPYRTVWSTSAEGWFSCGYGPFRRVSGSSAEAARLVKVPIVERYLTMFQEAASLSEVDQWLKHMRLRAYEKHADEEFMLTVICDLLNDSLMPNDISVDRVDSSGLWLKDRNGTQLSWDDMSDGYRSCIALVIDIVRHLFGCYGIDDLVTRTGGHVVFRKSGVVLIDELDAHLHPEWQQTIGGWLKKHFPRIQFIVTTHSPLVCHAASDRGLFHLPEPGSNVEPRQLSTEEFQEIASSRPNRILVGPAFGLETTRPAMLLEVRRSLALLNAKERAGRRLTGEETAEQKQLSFLVDLDQTDSESR